jgi:1-acyl-sn-glycerol-3-phosphate acyltransferase
VTPLELLRVRWDVGVPTAERALRVGTRVAGIGATALSAARRVRRLRPARDRDAARERARVLRDAARRALHLHGLELEVSGALPAGPALLASNHVSWLDPLVVASALPCVPISKLDVSGWPVVGALARDLGVVFVSRGDPRSGARALRDAAAAFGDGIPVLNFPEGTTTTGRTVLPFRPGLFGVARREAVPVVPVAIAYDPPELAWVGDDAFLPHWLGLAGSRRARAALAFGRAIQPDPGQGAAELARAAHDEVARLLDGLRSP